MINTYDLCDEIVNCLRMFGPSTVAVLQKKLELRDIEVSQLEILNACEFMVRFKIIRDADFGPLHKAFKL